MSFQQLLNANGIKHFTEKEVFENETPPAELWPNILPTLIVADQFREISEVPVKITSAYRSKERNEKEGGSKDSMHIYFNALDIRAEKEEDRREFYKYIKGVIEKGFILQCYFGREINISPKLMGVGYYPKAFRFHIDTRNLLGKPTPARWTV
jgi:uncharacterized protein YcbK (DUF882 family)